MASPDVVIDIGRSDCRPSGRWVCDQLCAKDSVAQVAAFSRALPAISAMVDGATLSVARRDRQRDRAMGCPGLAGVFVFSCSESDVEA